MSNKRKIEITFSLLVVIPLLVFSAVMITNQLGKNDNQGLDRTRILFAGESNHVWNKTYGGAGSESFRSMNQTADGGYALAGTVDYSAALLVKTDSNGNHLWNMTYDGASGDYCESMIQTADGGYALGGHTPSYGDGSPDFWLIKTDSSGNHLWNKTYVGIGSDTCQSIVQTVDGGYVLAGGTGSPAAGSYAWLVKTDSSGNHQWNKTYGGTEGEGCNSVILTADGGFAFVGSTKSYGTGDDAWLVKTDASGNHQWNQSYYRGSGYSDNYCDEVIQTADNGFAMVGSTYSAANGYDIWLVRTDSSGNHQWNRTYGGTGDDEGTSLREKDEGGFILAGYSDADAWLVGTDSSGNHAWNRTYGGTGYDWATTVILTADGGIAFAGGSDSYGDGSYDFWLVKLDGVGLSEGLGSIQVVFPVMLAVIASLIWYKKRAIP